MRDTNIQVHRAFDKLLVKDGIISNETETLELHSWMDSGVKEYGRGHQSIDPKHSPETIRVKIKNGKPLTIEENIFGKIKEFIKAKTRNQQEKTDLIRAAYGHEVVDNMWSKHKTQYKRNPIDREKFLENCLREFKCQNYHLKRYY